MILNVTWNGISADADIHADRGMTDGDVKRVAVELLRSGGFSGLTLRDLPGNAFDHYVVDRFDTPEGGNRMFLRPKVPFGCASSSVE
jgi:hypothetical protein